MYIYIYNGIYIYIYIMVFMIFTTKGFFEVAMELRANFVLQLLFHRLFSVKFQVNFFRLLQIK